MSLEFLPLRPKRLSGQIADLIREAIAAGKLKPGDRLPPERDLMRRFEVSRNTVRDAARILEMAGLVTIRRGARGGAFVTTPDPQAVSGSSWMALKASNLDISELYAVRRMIEPEVAEIAAEAASEEDIVALRAALEAPPNVSSAHGFHYAVASATRNKTLMLVVQSLMQLADQAEEATRPRRASFAIYQAHVQIFDAIVARDAARARELTMEHLEALQAEATGALRDGSGRPRSPGRRVKG